MTRPLHLLLPLLILLSACVYRQDIPQGNFFKEEDVEKLEVGMTREQVRFVMGTPMIRDPFHPERWDYVFYVDSQQEERNRYQRVTVFFEGDALARFETLGVSDESLPLGTEGIVPEKQQEDPFRPVTN